MTQPRGYNPQETHTEDGLPRERLRGVHPRTLVIEWSVAVAVVLLINVVAFAALERFDPNRFRVQVGVKYDRVRSSGADYDSLILGDSTPNQGVVPAMLNERVGGAWLNLATVADMQAFSDAWLLNEYIKRFGAPRRVLICHVPDMWRRKIDPDVLAQAPVPIDGFDDLDPSIELSRSDQLLMVRSRYLPIYSKHSSLTQMVKMPWSISDLRGSFGADGFMAVTGQMEQWDEQVKAAIAEHKKKPYALSRHNAEAMARIIELAEEHGFEVYLTPGSVSDKLAASPGYRDNFDAMISQYRRWADSSDRVVLLLPEPTAFDSRLMYDEDHVNLKGAEAWTQLIADAMLGSDQTSSFDPDEETAQP